MLVDGSAAVNSVLAGPGSGWAHWIASRCFKVSCEIPRSGYLGWLQISFNVSPVKSRFSCVLCNLQAVFRGRPDRSTEGIRARRLAGYRRWRECRLFFGSFRKMGRRRWQSYIDRAGGPKLQQPDVRTRTRRSLDRVEALKAVAAALPGMTHLEINPLHPADHKLSRDGTGLPVTAVTLDELVREKGHLRPALVKIDVQGAEMLVLKGADNIWISPDRRSSSNFMKTD